MPRKTSEFPPATSIDASEFLVRQDGNKRLPLSLLDGRINQLSGASVATGLGDYFTKTQSDARFINVVGDTMTGALTLAGAPTVPLHAASKDYVDTAVAGVSGGGGTGGTGTANLTAVLAADVGVTEITLVPALTFSVLGGKVYAVQGTCFHRATSTNKGMRIGFGGTAGIQSMSIRVSAFDMGGVLVNKHTRIRDATGLVFPSSHVGADDNLVEIRGSIFVTAPGTFIIMFGASVQYDYTAIQKGSGASLELLGSVT